MECELHNVGIADQSGELIFEDEIDFSSTSRFVAAEGPNTIRVAVDALDNVLGERFSGVVMKIDVEGMELDVLAGARGLIENHRPVIFIEVGIKNEKGFWDWINSNLYEVVGASYHYLTAKNYLIVPKM